MSYLPILSMTMNLKASLCRDSVIYAGSINSSQDGVVVMPWGCSPCHTAGHGNCPKVVLPYETD